MLHLKKELVRLCTDKDIIVVGPSPYLEGKQHGQRINKFDVVIRTNDNYKIPYETWDDYGSRCDILYVNNAWLRRNVIKNKNKQHMRSVLQHIVHVGKTKLIIVKGKGAKEVLRIIFKKIVPEYDNYLAIEQTTYLWKNQRHRWLKGFEDENSYYEPTLLSYILSDLQVLENNSKKIVITGCDFYQNTGHWPPHYNRNIDPKKEALARKKIHSVEGDKEYLRHRQSEQDIELDDVLKKILNP
jgi:hypothetical protein